MSFQRRRFLKIAGGGTVAGLHALGLGTQTPQFLAAAAEQASNNGSDRVLVVIQLSGGNDGLNTVIPFEDDAYHRARPTLRIPANELLKIDETTGLHPALSGFANLVDEGLLSIVQGVGYEHPNRSHFESMDIWHTCQTKSPQRTTGWLGRYLDLTAPLSPAKDVLAMHLGGEQQPLAVQARDVRVSSVKSVDEFKLRTSGNEDLRRTVAQIVASERSSTSDLLGFVQSSTSAALTASDRVAAAQSNYQTSIDYPESDLARKLRIIAQLINAGLTTRIYYVTLDGFDTHSQQADVHTALLREWSEALTAFVADMREHGQNERVLTLSFSEFGRRVAENASKGTDHGAAAPVFLAGGPLRSNSVRSNSVRGGLIGSHPSLTELDDGDLRFHTDFRQVYATLLEDWLSCDAHQVLAGAYPKLDLFAK